MSFSLSKIAKGLALGGFAAAMATSAIAATQGTPGFTSTGSLVITVDVNDEVRISSLADINLGPFAGVDMTGSSPACIYRNGIPTTYQITGTGSGAANAFTLTDGTNTVPYSVDYTDLNGTNALTTGSALLAQDGADNDVNCANTGDNGSIDVTVTAVDAAALPAAAYTGTLTLVVAPN
ncbi:MAG: hypothetical protein ACR2PZ_06035 [Pseudomonadales bacterium]